MIMTWSTKCLNTMGPGNTLTYYWTGSPLFTQWLEIWIQPQQILCYKMNLEMSSANWRPFCFDLKAFASNTLSLDGFLHGFRSLRDGVLYHGVSIVCLTACSDSDQRKHQSSASVVTGGFPSQRDSNAEMFTFNNVIMYWPCPCQAIAVTNDIF